MYDARDHHSSMKIFCGHPAQRDELQITERYKSHTNAQSRGPRSKKALRERHIPVSSLLTIQEENEAKQSGRIRNDA